MFIETNKLDCCTKGIPHLVMIVYNSIKTYVALSDLIELN